MTPGCVSHSSHIHRYPLNESTNRGLPLNVLIDSRVATRFDLLRQSISIIVISITMIILIRRKQRCSTYRMNYDVDSTLVLIYG